MSRKENIKRNLIFNMIKYVTQLVLQFVLRTFLIYIMGAEYLGLNGLFTNVFGFLSLAELGIGNAIVFSMYKPIADGDIEKVKSLQALYKKFYFIIATVVALLGLLIAPFLKYFINGGVTVDINIYLLYILYLVNTLVGYLSAHKRSLLFAFQRNDVENKIKTICLFGMTIAQIVVLAVFKNYYIYFTVNIVFTILEGILVYVWSNKMFPQIYGKSQPLQVETTKEIKKNIVAMSMHRVGWVLVCSTDNIIISALLGLTLLGAYSNYYLIITSLTALFTLISTALTGSVGNLIASQDKEYVYERYQKIQFLYSLLCSFITVCLICLFQPFIKVWTGGGIYMLDFASVILLSLSFYLNRKRDAVLVFRDTAGLFWNNRFAPIFESLINLVTSIILGIFIGLKGIIIGTILSTVLVPLWVEPWVLFKNYFNKSVWNYLKTYIRDFVIMVVVACACYGICLLLPAGGIWWLILRFAVCAVLCALLLFIMYVPTKEFRGILQGVKNKIQSLKNKKTSK